MSKADFFDLIDGNYPSFEEVDFLHTQDAISRGHFAKFFKMRGWIHKVSPLTVVPLEDSPARYEYEMIFNDELGTIKLSSPLYSDERILHDQLVQAFNNEDVIELLIFIAPHPELDAKGKIQDHTTRVVTYWPVQVRVLDKFEEEAAFIWTGKEWEITFRSATEPYPDENGFYYLHELLKKPDEEISALDLTVGRRGVVIPNIEVAVWKDYMFNAKAKDKEIDGFLKKLKPDVRKAVKSLNREIIKFEDGLGDLDPHANKPEIEECETMILQLKEEIFHTLDMKDENGDTATSLIKHTSNYVGKAVRRALKKIESKQPILHAIIVKRFDTGAHCRYIDRVEHPILWIT